MKTVPTIIAVKTSYPKTKVIMKPTRAGITPFIRAKIASFHPIFDKISVLTSMPAMNIRKTAPIDPKKSIWGVNSTRLRPKGPTAIPASNKATTYGR